MRRGWRDWGEAERETASLETRLWESEGEKYPGKWTRSEEVGRSWHREFIFDDTFKPLKKLMLLT